MRVSAISISLPGLSSHPKVSDRPADCDRTKIGILVDSWRSAVDNYFGDA